MMPDLTKLYRMGRALEGWRCFDCKRAFALDGAPRRRFTALTLHMLARHGRLPRLFTPTTYTFRAFGPDR